MNDVLTAPRFTGVCHPKSSFVCTRYDAQRSFCPKPPGRSLLKNIQCSSRESAGTFSRLVLLTTAPRFTGGPHGASRLTRRDTQMSRPPKPPGRSDPKNRLSPSFAMAGPASVDGELITGPRFTGTPQSEYMGAALGYEAKKSS